MAKFNQIVLYFHVHGYNQANQGSTMQEEMSFGELLGDYPRVVEGLKKLKIIMPTDLQAQMLEVSADMDHLILTAPQTAGKRVALLLHALRKFSSEEEGLLVVLAHSTELSQQIHHFLSVCLNIQVVNLYMQKELKQFAQKAVIVGSPVKVNDLWKKQKDRIVAIVIPEVDMLFGFGYGQALQLLAGSLNVNKVEYKLCCTERGAQIQAFKGVWMKKAHRIDYQLPQTIEMKEEKEEQITHFYGVGDKMSVPITLYVTLKFGLVNPKILILVENLREVYRYALFLQRCRIPQVGVYNHEDPINLRFYVLSVWMTGTTNIMISTPQLLEEINGDVFKKMTRKKFRRQSLQLINLSAIISLGLNHIDKDYSKLIQGFHVKPFLMTFSENTQIQIGRLQELIAFQRKKFDHAIIKELPITKKQIQGFRYRVNDVWSGLSNHRADMFRQLDFKKKLLKTPELKEQFEANGKERQVLVKSINDLRMKIDHGKVAISEFVPQYLVPECLKASHQQKMKVLQDKQEQETPRYHQKVKKVLRYVNLEEQNPQTTDISRLKLISARKRWKLLHGFKLKKTNKRLQKKGVFQS